MKVSNPNLENDHEEERKVYFQTGWYWLALIAKLLQNLQTEVYGMRFGNNWNTFRWVISESLNLNFEISWTLTT